jgi:hypothetical protein
VKNRHLSALEIQDYALGGSDHPNAVMEHITSCDHCRAEIKAYTMLFSAIDEQTGPAFHFDISALVIPQLKRHNTRFTVDRFVAGFLVIFAASCIGIPIYIFRGNILYMFSGVPVFFIYAIIGSSSVFVITKIFLMYKKYQHQMRYLNIH